MKLKDLLKQDKSKQLNEASLASYYNRANAPVKSIAKKLDHILSFIAVDKRQEQEIIELITDLADAYAEERIENLDSERN